MILATTSLKVSMQLPPMGEKFKGIVARIATLN